MTNAHVIPSSPEMEAATVGAMMYSPRALETVLDEVQLTDAMFENPDCRRVFQTINAMYEQGIKVDELTVLNRIKGAGLLTGGLTAGTIMSLPERCPAVANVREYATEVRDLAVVRSLIRRGEQIAKLGYERPDKPDALIDEAGRIIDEMTSRVGSTGEARIRTMADHLQPFLEGLEERARRGSDRSGLPTGFAALDARWGGLQPGKLIIIAGRPGMGKSALAQGMAEAMAFGADADVLNVNLEMTPGEQAGRLIARTGSVNLHRLVNASPTPDDISGAKSTIERIRNASRRLHVDEAAELTVQQICRRARKLNRDLKRDGRKLDALIVDYLGKIKKPRGMRPDQDYASVTYSSGVLKALALDLEIPVIVLAQLNRTVEARPDKTPNLSDLRDSGAIEQDADIVSLIYRPEYYLKKETPPDWVGVAQIETAKARGAEPGEDLLRWRGAYTRFSDYRPEFHVAGGAV